MELNKTKLFLLTIFSVNLSGVLSNKLLADLLANNVLDKSSFLHLLQLLFTAKLLKDYQYDGHTLPNDPQTNYMLFLGKGNIQFQNHELDVHNTSEPTDYETTTFSSDLAQNKHLLKFVARNGYDVWKRLLVVPYNSSAKEFDSNPTDHTFVENSNIIEKMVITTTDSPEDYLRPKPSKGKYDDKYVKALKKLYKPDLQMIETEEGFIKHQVKPPKWVKNIIENESEKVSSLPSSYRTSKSLKKTPKKYIGIDRNMIITKVKKKGIDKSGSVRSDKTVPTKYINNKSINNVIISPQKKSPLRPTLQPINKKFNKREKQSNRIGNIVIKGFNGLIRGIGSILGVESSQE